MKNNNTSINLNSQKRVITRFAPSPTGFLHLGGARTALFAFLYAKNQGGQFLLRLEDTDKERSSPEFAESIFEGLRWLGMESDGAILVQSQREELYQNTAVRLIEEGKAYYCTCSKERLDALREAQMNRQEKPRYDEHCRDLNLAKPDVPHVVRFKIPHEGNTHFVDAVRGEITVQNHELDDFVLQKSEGGSTYNFSAVIDDAASEITHVIRGEDHINNTPKQILLYQALDWAIPVFAHASMIHGTDGAKLSKRHGAVDVLDYKKQGFLPGALRNFLLRLGFSKGDQELFTDEEMIQLFSLDRLSKSKAVFNAEKLLWINAEKLKQSDGASIVKAYNALQEPLLADHPKLEALAEIYKNSCKTLLEHREAAELILISPLGKALKSEDADRLSRLSDDLKSLDVWEAGAIDACIQERLKKEDVGFAKLGKPIRLALWGVGSTPALGALMALMDRFFVQDRLQNPLKEAE